MPTVLIVDDNPASFESLADVLEIHELAAVGAKSAEEALELIQQERPDCILLDTVLPGMDGFELCEKLKSQPETATIPILFLTGRRRDEAAVVRALDLGAADFLVKPVRMPELVARIQAAMRTKTAREVPLGEPVGEQAIIQGRPAFLQRLQQELDRSVQLRRPLTCVVVNLEPAPGVAEQLSPEQAGTIEEQLAPEVRACCRGEDICGHVGDRRCAFILFSPAETGGRALAERIRDRVTQAEVMLQGQRIPVNVCAGVAEALLKEPPTAEELMSRAEEALAQARSAGPGTIAFWSPPSRSSEGP